MISFLRYLVSIPIHLYRIFISPMLSPRCRFYPTCSAYMLDALKKHGIFRGFLLGVRRLGKCHPWHSHHGHDPVPKEFTWRLFLGYKREQHIQNIQNKSTDLENERPSAR